MSDSPRVCWSEGPRHFVLVHLTPGSFRFHVKSPPGHFVPGTFRSHIISVPGHFGPGLFHSLVISDPWNTGRSPCLIRIFVVHSLYGIMPESSPVGYRRLIRLETNLHWVQMTNCWFCRGKAQIKQSLKTVSMIIYYVHKASCL